jgi:hypothetical protein
MVAKPLEIARTIKQIPVATETRTGMVAEPLEIAKSIK